MCLFAIQLYSFLKFFFNVYLFFRDTEIECELGKGRERKWGTESEAGFRLWAVSTGPNVGLELINCDCDQSRSQLLNWLSHPGAFAIQIYSLVKCLFKFFIKFLNLVSFLMLNLDISWHILDTSPLSDMCLQILFPKLHLSFTAYIVSFKEQKFIILIKPKL